MIIAVLGVVIGLMANMLTTTAVLTLLAEPVGARIRPMGLVNAPCAGALFGLCGGTVSLMAAREPETRWAGVAGLVLGVLPFPLGLVLLRYVLEIKQLVLLP